MNLSELNICGGCLSVDRDLVNFSEDMFMLFCYLLGTDYSEVKLCWECAAYMKRFLRFKQQLKRAHHVLSQLVLDDIKPLSSLKITKCDNVREYSHNYEIAFVRMEDHNSDGVNEYDIDLQLPKPEPIESVITADEEFDDSDDEPLMMKQKASKKKKGQVKRKKEKVVIVNNARVDKKLKQLNIGDEHIEMVVLTWDEVRRQRARALSSESFTRHEYKCHDCVLGFNHRCKLEQHMVKHYEASGSCVCSLCRVRCKDERALAAHERRHRVRWRCRWCGGTWSRAAVCADHAAREHCAPTPTHTCGRCGHTETSLGRLRNHIKNHSERQKCDLCGKTFRDRTSLKTHLLLVYDMRAQRRTECVYTRRIHKGEKEYSCPRCDKKFLFKKAMEIHLVTHEAPAHLYCYQCDMNFKNRMSYNQHLKYSLKHVDPADIKLLSFFTYGAAPVAVPPVRRQMALVLQTSNSPHACKLCDKRFVKAARLQEHNLAVHLKMTPVKCTVAGCGFACSSKPVLRSHIRSCHRLAGRVRNHVCHVCGNAYTSNKSLEGHLRSHAGSRPLHCARCPATFAYDAALYNHTKLVHRDIQPTPAADPARPASQQPETQR
ncbi:zinc finger protein 729 [Danaus plexippus plexippus]|uniref:Zinc finger protein 729 n=1 Tax=Danaus plexippus plexippus TaxID=278856 RepID=A0A212FHB4_DANPL|nr:zinc finger protein 729 [Danaus plexippus plexippus]